MNLVAVIGIVETVIKNKDITKLILKVEKPFHEKGESYEEYYDKFDVELNSFVFSRDIKNLSNGTLVGLKGRIKPETPDSIKVIAERLQIF